MSGIDHAHAVEDEHNDRACTEYVMGRDSNDDRPVEDGTQRCRDCDGPFPYDEDADRCPACSIAAGVPRQEVIERLQDEGLNDDEIEQTLPGGLLPDERRVGYPAFVLTPVESCWCGFPLRDGRCGLHGDETTVSVRRGCRCSEPGWGASAPPTLPATRRVKSGNYSLNVCVECGGTTPTERSA